MADRRVKPAPIQRSSKNSLKAGKVPGLGSSRGRASGSAEFGSKNKKPGQVRDLRRRIEDAEKQTEAVGIDVEPEVPESQTNRELPEMPERKSMIVPGSRDALKFQSARPRELRRFIMPLEDLWKEAGITEDKDKKESLGKYADQESEEEWSALETYNDGYTWGEFKRIVGELPRGIGGRERYTGENSADRTRC